MARQLVRPLWKHPPLWRSQQEPLTRFLLRRRRPHRRCLPSGWTPSLGIPSRSWTTCACRMCTPPQCPGPMQEGGAGEGARGGQGCMYAQGCGATQHTRACPVLNGEMRKCGNKLMAVCACMLGGGGMHDMRMRHPHTHMTSPPSFQRHAWCCVVSMIAGFACCAWRSLQTACRVMAIAVPCCSSSAHSSGHGKLYRCSLALLEAVPQEARVA